MSKPSQEAASAEATEQNNVVARSSAHAAGYIRPKDLGVLAKLPLAALTAWTLPEPWWDRVAAVDSSFSRWLPSRKSERDLEHLLQFMRGSELEAEATNILGGYARNVRLIQMQYLRSHHFSGWRPDIKVIGRDHLDQALEAGRGAIVWAAPFVFSQLVTKMALHAAGYELVHLSRTEHGYSPTRFGVRMLNPVRSRVENRYLAERIVIGDDSLQKSVRSLAQRLVANRIVSITVGAKGLKICQAPFMQGQLQIATGAPSLILRTGAALLPVVTVREGPGRFTTFVEPPLRAHEGGNREAMVQELVAGLTTTIERYAVRWPDQFHWNQDITGRHRSSE